MDYESIELSKFLVDFTPLVHKVLSRLHISPSHMDYDDYFQELQLHLLRIRENYQAPENNKELDEDAKRYIFTAYANKGLYWHGINLVKRQQKGVFNPIEDEDLEWLDQKQGASSLQSPSRLYLDDFFQQAKKRLAAEDYLLLLYLSDDQYSMEEIQALFGVNRSTIYRRKKRIQEKLAGIKQCLTL